MKTTLCGACGFYLFLAMVLPLSANIPIGEREALIDLYHATGGDDWSSNVGWLGDPGSEGEWYGVTVSDDHVTHLRLSMNNLVGELPATLANLIHLEVLDLHQNQFTGHLPLTLGNLTGLRNLNLARNSFEGPLPVFLTSLPELISVNLSDNRFSGLLPSNISGFQGLNALYLSGNYFEGPIPDEIRQLEDVRLNIDWNLLYTSDLSLADFLQTMLKPSGPDWEEFQITPPGFNGVGSLFGKVVVFVNEPPCRIQLGQGGGYYLLSYGTNPGGPYPFQAFSTNLDSAIIPENLPPDENLYGVLQTVAEPLPGFFWNTITSTPGNEFIIQGTPHVPTSGWVLHRLTSNGIANLRDGLADLQPHPEPLLPAADIQLLVAQPPVTEGLVADGVTPLLLRLEAVDVTEELVFHVEYEYEGSGRIADISSNGSTIDGLTGRMKVLRGGEWRSVVDEAGPLVLTPEEPKVFFLIEALEPGDLTGLPAGDHDVVINLRAVATELGEVLAEQSVKVRRPPLALISSSPPEPWSQEFLDVLKESRAPEFIQVFAPFYPFDLESTVNIALSWGQDFRDQWAVTRIDTIAHGRGGVAVAEEFARVTESQNSFRTEENFFRGHFRRTVGLGVPHYGSGLLDFFKNLDQKLDELSIPNIGPLRGFMRFISMSRGKFLNRGHSPESLEKMDYDPAAQWHDVGSVIDPKQSMPALYLGLTEERYNRLFPQGTDGSSSITDMTGTYGGLTQAEGFVSHKAPHQQHGGDSTQTSTPAVARVILDLLDGADRSSFEKLNKVTSTYYWDRNEMPEVAEEVILDPGYFIEAVILSTASARSLSASNDNAQRYRYAIDPPEEAPLTGTVTWIAKTLTGYVQTSDGVRAVPDPVDSARVTVEIDDDVIGDTALFFSYPTIDDRVVFGIPVLVQRRSPPDATLVGIEVEPPDRALLPGQTFQPEVTALYSDGTRLPCWITADDLEVTPSHPEVVDVSNILLWKAKGAGTCLLTVSFEGQTTTCELTVDPPSEALTFDEWRALFYTVEELADPLVSGADVDLDGDGMTVLFEYMVDGHPQLSDSNRAPVSDWVRSGSGSNPILLASFSSRMSDYTVRVDRSLDLKTWQTWYELDGIPDETDPRVQAFENALNRYRIIFDLALDATEDSAFYRLNFVPAE